LTGFDLILGLDVFVIVPEPLGPVAGGRFFPRASVKGWAIRLNPFVVDTARALGNTVLAARAIVHLMDGLLLLLCTGHADLIRADQISSWAAFSWQSLLTEMVARSCSINLIEILAPSLLQYVMGCIIRFVACLYMIPLYLDSIRLVESFGKTRSLSLRID
jgi:hypothetical protein